MWSTKNSSENAETRRTENPRNCSHVLGELRLRAAGARLRCQGRDLAGSYGRNQGDSRKITGSRVEKE